jgi:hypothetical protein
MHFWVGRRLGFLLLAGIMVGCRFDGRVRDGEFRCESTSECPDGRRCAAGLQLCVEVGTDSTPPVFSGLRLSPALGRASTVFNAQFDVDESLLSPAQVTLVLRDGTTEPFAFEQGAYRFISDGGQREGDMRLRVSGLDRFGNRGQAESAVLGQLDFTAPDLLASSISFVSPTAVVPTVDALGIGGVAVVSVRLDEPAMTAALEVLPAGVVTVESSSGTLGPWGVRLNSTLDGGVGALALSLRLVDEAGNQRQASLASVPFDAVPPSFAPDADVVLERAPQPEGFARVSVSGRGVGVTLVRVVSSDGGLELARAPVSGDGAFDVTVPDVATATVQLFDAVGNASALQPISRADWRFALSGCTRLALGASGPGLYRPDGVVVPIGPLLAVGTASWEKASHSVRAGGASLMYSRDEGRLLRLSDQVSMQRGQAWVGAPFDAQVPLGGALVASDGPRGGGWGLAAGILYEIKERRMRRVSAIGAVPPSAVYGASLAALDGVLVVVGGQVPILQVNRSMHLLRGAVWSQRQDLPTISGSVTADTRRRRFLMAGSYDGGAFELWEGDSQGGSWRFLEPLSGRHHLVYVASRDVLWAAVLRNEFQVAEVVEFAADGGRQRWPTTLSVGTHGLSCAADEASGLVSCEGGQTVLRFVDGGFESSGVTAQMHPPGDGIRVAAGPRPLVHGGTGTAAATPGLYRWADGRYEAVAIDDAGMRARHFFAVNPATGEAWVSAGYQLSVTPTSQPTGGFDSREVSTAMGTASWQGSWRARSAQDVSEQQVGFFADGGLYALGLNASHQFSAAGWAPLPHLNPMPPPFSLSVMHAVSADGRLFALNGGRAFGVTSAPFLWRARFGAALQWAQLAPSPTNLTDGALIFDEERQTVLAVGGTVLASGSTSETLEFSLDGGVGRVRLSDPEGDADLPPVSGIRGVYESSRSRSLVVGSIGNESSTWALHYALNRPAVRLAVPFAGLGLGAFDAVSVDLTVAAVATGMTLSVPRIPQLGYQVVAHVDGAFREVGRRNNDGPIRVVLAPITLSQLSPSAQLVLEVRPLGINGSAEASVEVTAFSAIVTQRR